MRLYGWKGKGEMGCTLIWLFGHVCCHYTRGLGVGDTCCCHMAGILYMLEQTGNQWKGEAIEVNGSN